MHQSYYGKLRRNTSAAALACALACGGAAAGWQQMVAHFDYGGNWTAFYRVAEKASLPPAATLEPVYRQTGSVGYDGQYYFLIAHDPLILHGTERYIDAPRLRYRRILIPALAWLLALGHVAAATYTYMAVVLLFLALGAYWVSRYAVLAGASPWWGLTFFAVPGAFLSLDRLTIDIAMATLAVGFALYWRAGPRWKLYLVLLAAPLARETGFLLLGAYCLYTLLHKEWLKTAVMATSGIPAALWSLYVRLHTPDYPSAWLMIPFQAAAEAMLHPEHFPARKWYITPFEYLAWLGLILAIAMGIARLRKDSPLAIAAFFFALLATVINLSVWEEVESFGRVFTPLIVLLPLARPDWRSLLPLAAMLPRASTYPLSETLAALRAML